MTTQTNTKKPATGTREWAGSTLNVACGCSHGCLYCYARSQKLRYGQIETAEAWTRETIYQDRVDHTYNGGRGTIMFPSAHDITPATVDAVGTVACRLLEPRTPLGHEQTRLLLVTKADGPCVQQLAERIDPMFRHRVLWRISIGCLNEHYREFWEPGAPPIEMRLETLRWLRRQGWATSVSCEPLLDPPHAVELVQAVMPWVSETVWIGLARDLAQRTAWARKTLGERLAKCVTWLQDRQTPEWVCKVAMGLQLALSAEDCAKVRYKDSYAEILRQPSGLGWQIEDGIVMPGPP